MSFASGCQPMPGKRPGEQDRARFGLRGSTDASKASLLNRARRLALRHLVLATNGDLGEPAMPKATQSPLLYAFRCFPPASPALAPGAGKQKRPRRAAFICLILRRKFGAGEGIRTLDPNLGKVVLYP